VPDLALKVWHELPQPIKDAIAQSPSLIIVMAVTFYAYRQLANEHKAHLNSNDKEIERLVTEKNAAEGVSKNRLSTDDKSKGRGGSK
jgi:hypothetical protein